MTIMRAQRWVRARLGSYRSKVRSAAWPKLQRSPLISTGARVTDPKLMRFGDAVRIGHGAELSAFSHAPDGGPGIVLHNEADIRSGALLHAYGGRIEVGRYSCINHYCFINGAGGVTIGDDVMMGTGCAVLSSEHGIDQHATVPMTRQPTREAPVVIEQNVYLGANVVVLAGVTIGTGSIVAAGAVVTRDVAPYSRVGGVPARSL